MADIHGDPRTYAPMPQADNAGTAPVPYHGPDFTGIPLYSADMGPMADAAGHVMAPIPPGTLGTAEQAYAHDASGSDHDAPYDPGSISPVFAGGDADAGGRDDVGGSVQASVDAATARWNEHMGDNGHTGTPGPGAEPVHPGTIGDLVHFPPSGEDPGVGVGNTTTTGDFYDPPRDYGGPSGAPGYGGEQGAPGFQGKAL